MKENKILLQVILTGKCFIIFLKKFKKKHLTRRCTVVLAVVGANRRLVFILNGCAWLKASLLLHGIF